MAEKKKASPLKKVPAKKAGTKKASVKKVAVKVAEKPRPRTLTEKVRDQKEDILASLKRTLIPMAVGAISASAIGPFVDIDAVQNLLSALIAAVYYTVVRFAEVQNPKAGLLLGSTTPPTYKD